MESEKNRSSVPLNKTDTQRYLILWIYYTIYMEKNNSYFVQIFDKIIYIMN